MILEKAQKIMVDMLIEIDRICKKHGIEYYISDGTLLGAIRHKGFIPWDDDLDISMTRENYRKFEKIAIKEIGKDYFVQTIDTEKAYSINGCPMKIRHLHSLFKEVERSNVEYQEGIFIDIFPMDKLPKSKRYAKFQRSLGKLIFQLKDNYDGQGTSKNMIKGIFKPVSFKLFRGILRSTLWVNEKYGTDNYTYGVDTYFYNDFIYSGKNLFPLQRIEFEGGKFLAPHNPDAILTELYGDYMKLPPIEDRYVHSTHIEIYEVNNEREIFI